MWQFQPKPGHLQSPSGLSVIYEITSSALAGGEEDTGAVAHPRSGDRWAPAVQGTLTRWVTPKVCSGAGLSGRRRSNHGMALEPRENRRGLRAREADGGARLSSADSHVPEKTAHIVF